MKFNSSYKPLGEVFEIIGGGTPSKKKEVYYTGDIPWATVRDMNTDLITNTDFSITEDAVKKSSTNVIKSGNVIIATRVGLGKVCILERDTAINQDLKGIIPKSENVDRRFLLNWFKSIESKIVNAGTGATVQGVKLPFIRNLQFPLIPLPEQKRIVEILDEAFEAIDQAKANIEQNIQNAEELFQSKLNEVFRLEEDSFSEELMVDVCSILTCGVASTPEYVDESEGVPFLSAQNVQNGKVVLDKYRYITKEFHTHLTKKNNPQKGDILYSRVGAKFGDAGVVEHDFDFSVYVSLTLIRPIKEKLNNYYLKYYLNSPTIKKLAKESITSSGVPNLNVGTVRKFPVVYPSLKRQLEIVNYIQNLEENYRMLIEKYLLKLKNIEELKKSILKKAFSGKLTANEEVAA